ncbi:hypothetical protein A6V39_04595 [Candidatus Mycoplasma haematobovis]|uniref:ABC transmembrane type-1 domain-containing protein n=1 Tax=Candidatus Mycoplasma haematobovis TaxID=432608 RepID=A0A1A9QCI8_9MOLU|nr:ABC transporter permease subunit [Candidatus Mycoplasma haematobovis]OAL10163.1 hypothetical protein A6V39_04595 [Candidatus Mycoplasma haematobovis]
MNLPISLDFKRLRVINSRVKVLSEFATYFLCFLFGTFFVYIFFKGFQGLFSYSFRSIFFSGDFSAKSDLVSFWAPFGVTAFLVIIVLLLAIPISLRCSIWISFYASPSNQKFFSLLTLLLANIPSVVLGIFVKNYLANYLKALFKLSSTLNLLTAAVALIFMMLPLVISIFNAAFENKTNYLVSSEVLGVSRIFTIYKILIPRIRKTTLLATTIIVSRVLSESVMLFLILNSQSYSTAYSSFGSFINSQVNPIAPLISENFFSDGSDEKVKNLMFLFGALLLLISLLVNAICYYLIKQEPGINKASAKLSKRAWFNNLIKWYFIKCVFYEARKLDNNKLSIHEYIFLNLKKYKPKQLLLLAYRVFEKICISIFCIFAFLLLTSITVEGIEALANKKISSGDTTLYRAFINTLLVVIISIFLSFPLAFLSSIFLSEYAGNTTFKKYILCLINVASSTPSIIFGIFGLSFFISNLGLTGSGVNGKSLLAGILTITLLILPYMINLFLNHISNIPNIYRVAAYTLGISKHKTFLSIILPLVLSNLIFAVLLSVGRIMGETAPLYLTAGMNSINTTLLLYPGQTLTTRIYSQRYGSNITEGNSSIAETSFCCVSSIFLVILLGKCLIPFIIEKVLPTTNIWLNQYSNNMSYYWNIYMNRAKKTALNRH